MTPVADLYFLVSLAIWPLALISVGAAVGHLLAGTRFAAARWLPTRLTGLRADTGIAIAFVGLAYGDVLLGEELDAGKHTLLLVVFIRSVTRTVRDLRALQPRHQSDLPAI